MDTEADTGGDPLSTSGDEKEPKFRNGRELGKIVWITGAVHGFLGILSIPFLARMEPAFQLNGNKMLGLPIFIIVVGFIATGLQLAGSGCATKTVRVYQLSCNLLLKYALEHIQFKWLGDSCNFHK